MTIDRLKHFKSNKDKKMERGMANKTWLIWLKEASSNNSNNSNNNNNKTEIFETC